MADLEYKIENGVGTILLNRPEKKNAFTVEMVDQWAEILVGAHTDDSVGVIVVTGAGDAFCAGGDFGGFRRMPRKRRGRTSARRSSPTTSTASPTR